MPERVYADGRLRVARSADTVELDGDWVRLTTRELQLLWFLIVNRPRVMSRERILWAAGVGLLALSVRRETVRPLADLLPELDSSTGHADRWGAREPKDDLRHCREEVAATIVGDGSELPGHAHVGTLLSPIK